MKKIFTLLSLLFVFNLIDAKQIDENTARQIGINFLSGYTNSNVINSATQLNLVYTATPEDNSINGSGSSEKYFYIFNISKNGFVIVSADDIISPVLGYSNANNFNIENLPSHISSWLDGYKKEIQYAIENKLQPSESVVSEWENLKQENLRDIPQTKAVILAPLLKTTWNQAPYYNALCPYDEDQNDRTVTGCVATAMAQVMKYWNFPSKGTGSHSYYTSYGLLSADFGNTTYKWETMPNSLSGTNNAIATLMYHLGVSIEMNYGTSSTGGSGAWMIAENSQYCSENALKDYFGYKRSMQGIQRYGYTDAQWLKLIKDELNAYRPVIYVGYGNGGGHCFVADGYDDNNYFHFNWGWGGNSDGYFKLNALNPGSLGVGGGTGGFNAGQQILIGIEPEYGNPDYNITLNTAITAPQNTIQYNKGFNFSADIQNKGDNIFKGDFVGTVMDHSFNIIAYFDTVSNNSMNSSATQNLTFDTDGLFSVVPGDYYLCVYYRPEGDNRWYKVSNNQGYTNLMDIKIINSGKISLNSDFNISTGNSFTEGKPASVKVNITNNNFDTFFGKYNLSLYNVDGTLAQVIGEYEENNGLAYAQSYNYPYVDFSSNNINLAPGTYILALKYRENNLDWEFSGAGNFQNPMFVKILPPPLNADKYEQNNTLYWSYNLPLNSINDINYIKTEGANIHTVSDKDYYKIILPEGSKYSVKANLKDAGNSSGNMEYTLDAAFTYSTNGKDWSGNIDSHMNSGVNMDGGSTFYLKVFPNTDQEMGTYDLEIEVTKNTTGNVNNTIPASIHVFPNPVKDVLMIDTENYDVKINQVELYNMQGQLMILSKGFKKGEPVYLGVETMANGIYFLRINTENGMVSQKIIIEK